MPGKTLAPFLGFHLLIHFLELRKTHSCGGHGFLLGRVPVEVEHGGPYDVIPAGVLLASSAALRFRFGPLVQQLRQLGQRHDRLRLPALADHGQCWGGCNAAGGQRRDRRNVETQRRSAHARHPVRDRHGYAVDLGNNPVDGGDHRVNGNFCQIHDHPENGSENIYHILPCGGPVAGKYIRDKLDQIRQNCNHIFDVRGYGHKRRLQAAQHDGAQIGQDGGQTGGDQAHQVSKCLNERLHPLPDPHNGISEFFAPVPQDHKSACYRRNYGNHHSELAAQQAHHRFQ